eukprot:evm.model.NODE_14489_length_1351_cov_29.897114.1
MTPPLKAEFHQDTRAAKDQSGKQANSLRRGNHLGTLTARLQPHVLYPKLGSLFEHAHCDRGRGDDRNCRFGGAGQTRKVGKARKALDLFFSWIDWNGFLVILEIAPEHFISEFLAAGASPDDGKGGGGQEGRKFAGRHGGGCAAGAVVVGLLFWFWVRKGW